MSAKQATTKGPGRPATGNTKAKPGITIDLKVYKQAKKRAFASNMSFSAWVEKAVRETLSAEVAQ